MTLFWALTGAAAAFVLYTYALYPLILLTWSRFRRAPAAPDVPSEWPRISLTVPVYNEVGQIRDTIESLLRVDYPADRRQILIVSDASTDGTDEIIAGYADRGVDLLRIVERRGKTAAENAARAKLTGEIVVNTDASTDGTDEIVAGYADRGVELLRIVERRGKTAAENAARAKLTGEIVVNTDASIRIRPDAVKPLVLALQDPTVGVASGCDVSTGERESSNVGESGYVGYEMWIRDLETRVGGIVGASGCFYAIRAELHQHILPSALSRDFASAMVARDHGYRAVSVPAAVCEVPRAPSLRQEYRRKLRTMIRGIETLYFKRHLLNVRRHGRFAWMLFSHKVCRWLVPWALVLGLIGVAGLSPEVPAARLVLAAAVVGLAVGAAGWLWPAERPMPRLLSLPTFALAANAAALIAVLRAARGELDPIWEPTRRTQQVAVPVPRALE